MKQFGTHYVANVARVQRQQHDLDSVTIDEFHREATPRNRTTAAA
jgi:hypothetical protein